MKKKEMGRLIKKAGVRGIMKRYIITGAGGHLGSTLLRMLKDRDVEVCALLLPQEKAAVQADNIRYVRGDVCRPDTLEALFTRADIAHEADIAYKAMGQVPSEEVIVIHGAGIISISRHVTAPVYEVNVNGTKNMIDMSIKHHVDRFVYVGSVHAIPELLAGRKIEEAEEFSPDLVVGAYAKTKAEATQAVLDAVKDGLPAVVVQPSGIIGPYDKGNNHLVQMVRDYMQGRITVCVKGGYDFVDVRDVAQGCLLAAEKGRTGRCYILSGKYCTIRDLLSSVGKPYGKKPLPVIPLFLARLAAPVNELIAKWRGKRPLYTAYSLYTLTSNSNFSNKRAMRELGYCARPLEETIRDTAAWNRPSGEKPAQKESSRSKLSGNRAAWNKSSWNRPAGNRAAWNKSSWSRPAGDRATGSKSAWSKSSGNRTVGSKSSWSKAAGNKSVIS